jgi:hypothetical protein
MQCYDNQGIGLVLTSNNYCSFTSIVSAQNDSDGMYVDAQTYSSITGFSIYANGGIGINATNTNSRLVISSGVTFGSTGNDGTFANLGTVNCMVHGVGYGTGKWAINNWNSTDNQNW